MTRLYVCILWMAIKFWRFLIFISRVHCREFSKLFTIFLILMVLFRQWQPRPLKEAIWIQFTVSCSTRRRGRNRSVNLRECERENNTVSRDKLRGKPKVSTVDKTFQNIRVESALFEMCDVFMKESVNR